MEGVLALMHAQLKSKEDDAYLKVQRKAPRDISRPEPREARNTDRYPKLRSHHHPRGGGQGNKKLGRPGVLVPKIEDVPSRHGRVKIL